MMTTAYLVYANGAHRTHYGVWTSRGVRAACGHNYREPRPRRRRDRPVVEPRLLKRWKP